MAGLDPYERFSWTLVAPPPKKAEHPSRSEPGKDRDRIIHSGAFRRLQRKSQIVGVQANDFFRTRLTHTVECAQIGRAIGLRSLNSDLTGVVADGHPEHLPDLIEAACLAHDLGHPPFGHNGERALSKMMREHAQGMFEGNAQSFRIVSYLEAKVILPSRPCGLDLTRATLIGILKYPWDENEAFAAGKKKFCIYDDDADRAVFEWLFQGSEPKRSLATEILESADDIAYAVHDFEDGVWSGMIPLSRILDSDDPARKTLAEKVRELGDEKTAADGKPLFDGVDIDALIEEFLLDEMQLRNEPWVRVPFDRSRESRAALKNTSASLIGTFIERVTDGDVFHKPDDNTQRRIFILTGMAWAWMIENPAQETMRFGQRRLVEDLFNGYWENPRMLQQRAAWAAIDSKGPTANDRRDSKAEHDTPAEALGVWQAKARLICDHIAGMTDLYALHVHGEMFQGGGPPGLRLTV